MSLGRKAAIGAGWMLAWRMVARSLRIGSTLALARLLVPADFGLVAMALTFEGAIQAFSTFPVYDALLRRPGDSTGLYDAAFTLQLGRALLNGIVVAAGAPLAAAWFGEPRLLHLLYALAVMTVVSGLDNIGLVDFQRQMRFDVQFKLQVLPSILTVIATIAVAAMTHSYWTLLIGLGVGRIGRISMGYMIHPYRPRLSLKGWQELAGFSFWLWLAGLATMAWTQLDSFLLGPAFGPAGLGLFLVALQLAELPAIEILEPVTSVLFASFAHVQREGSRAGRNPLLIAMALVLLLAPIALVISAAAADLVPLLLGSRWLAAIPLVTLAAWRVMLRPFQSVGATALTARGWVRGNFLIVSVGAVLRAVVVVAAVATGSLPIVIVATIVALAAGAILYAVPFWPELKAEGGGFLPCLWRFTIALGVTSLLLAGLGLGWQPQPAVAALASVSVRVLGLLLHVAAIGSVAVLAYVAALAGLWFACGKPNGPERMVLNLVQEFLPAKRVRTATARSLLRLR